MKKNIFYGFFVLTIAGITAFNTTLGLGNDKIGDFSLSNMEVLAITETACLSSSGTNEGTCKKKVNGTGDTCVKPGTWDTKNCYSELELPDDE